MADQLQGYLKELKSQAYDTLAQIEYLQRQLAQINQEIAKVGQQVSQEQQKKPQTENVEEGKQLLNE